MVDIAGTPQPSGTEKGRANFAAILDQVPREGGVTALDMSGIRLVDSSWAREVVASLIERYRGRRAFYLDGVAQPVVNENVDAALFRKGLCVLARGSDGAAKVLGREPSKEALQVLWIVQRQRETSARTVCAALRGLSMPACNNRLRDLLDAGLVVREESAYQGGGREFRYRALV